MMLFNYSKGKGVGHCGQPLANKAETVDCITSNKLHELPLAGTI